jgi:hypothetical protein
VDLVARSGHQRQISPFMPVHHSTSGVSRLTRGGIRLVAGSATSFLAEAPPCSVSRLALDVSPTLDVGIGLSPPLTHFQAIR